LNALIPTGKLIEDKKKWIVSDSLAKRQVYRFGSPALTARGVWHELANHLGRKRSGEVYDRNAIGINAKTCRKIGGNRCLSGSGSAKDPKVVIGSLCGVCD
jgi:hypothetical protein